MQKDPEQTLNLLSVSTPAIDVASRFTVHQRPLKAVISRLDALIMALKDCKGKACSRPWTTLHPRGGVASLREALHPEFDDFYDGQPKMYFDSCEAAFIKEKESNEPVKQYQGGKSGQRTGYDYGAEWILTV